VEESVQETTETAEETTVDKAEEQTTVQKESTESKGEESTDAAAYDLKTPEGFQVDSAMQESFVALAKEAGLKPELAQKVADLHFSVIQKAQESFNQTVEGWAKESEAAYGDKKEAVLEQAKNALSRFDPSGELAKDLSATGLGNKKAWIDLFAGLGAQTKEGSFVEASPAKAGGFLDKMYPTMR
jgi:arginyl-tRNA synthetase